MFYFVLFLDTPEITTHPKSRVIIEGSDIVLTCNATGNPTPLISWTIDGFVISSSGDPRINFEAGNKILNIRNVSRADEGEYRCVASNYLGDACSNATLLDVQCKYTAKESLHLYGHRRFQDGLETQLLVQEFDYKIWW